ncbi:hypothetical protein P4V95_05125 [Bacillus thuringiensis]|nr:hypothetical protein [Bacillus thuringiensis]
MNKFHWEKANEGERCKTCGTNKKVEVLYYGETRTESKLCMSCIEEMVETMEKKN